MSAVGFDIGSETCYIAVVKSGVIEVLDNEFSLRPTPTYIGFTNKCRDIGVEARTKLVTNLSNTVFGFKRILGEKHSDELQNELKYLPYDVCDLPSGNKGIKVNYLRNVITFSFEQLMAMILTKLKLITESKLGNKIRDCVIAIPVYYTDAQRRAVLDAVNIAGLNAIKLINETSAIALSYGFFKDNLTDEDSRNIVFVDLGKSCLTVTACAFTKDKVKILGHVWDHVGGRDFDNKLVQYFIKDFKERYNIDVSSCKKALMSLILECEMLKKVMSASSLEVNLQIECFMNDIDVKGKMKKELFEKLCDEVLSQIEWNFYRLLKKIELQPNDIHSVEIVGGSSRIPAVKNLIEKVFNRRPNETLNQDEAVARGCALQCAILSPSLKSRNYVLYDIPSFNVNIFWKNKESSEESLKLFSFCDKMPSSKLVTIYMGKPFSIEAYATNAESAEKLHKIGTFIFGNIPEDADKNGFMKIKVKASLNGDGIFSIIYASVIKVDKETEQNDKNIAPVSNANADIQMDENEKISNHEQLAQNVQMSCAVKSHELTIKSEVSGLTKIRLNEYINAEQQMICQDIEEKEKADARNVLEEFVYDFRGRLNNELKEFVLEKDKMQLFQNLNETQNWFEENDDLEAAEFYKKLKDLRNLFDPILLKYTEWEQRQSVVDDYRQTLQQAKNAFSDFIKKENLEITSKDDVENLLKIHEESEHFLNAYVEKVSCLKKVDEIPITVNELQTSLQTFKSKFMNLFLELRKKYNTEPENCISSSGDGFAENMET